MDNRKPTIGRIVHYQSRGSADGVYPPKPRAAIITEVHEDPVDGVCPVCGAEPAGANLNCMECLGVGLKLVDLCVVNPTGHHFTQDVPYSEVPEPGCWSWPPIA